MVEDMVKENVSYELQARSLIVARIRQHVQNSLANDRWRTYRLNRAYLVQNALYLLTTSYIDHGEVSLRNFL